MRKTHYTVMEVAHKLGVNKQTVYDWIRVGHIKAEKVEVIVYKTMISAQQLKSFTRPQMGRPKKTEKPVKTT